MHNGETLHTGQTILHERFGQGSIQLIEGTGSDCTITVQFENAGIRKLLLKFARFSVLD